MEKDEGKVNPVKTVQRAKAREDINNLRDRLKKQKGKFLKIERVPPKTYAGFVKFAKEEYCDDYGMALKFLWDFFNGYIVTGLDEVQIELQYLRNEIKKLKELYPEETKEVKKEPEVIVKQMADGSYKQVGKKQ